MKKRLVLVIGLTPVITHAFLPVCTAVAYLLGYNFSLFNYTFFAVVNVIVTVVAVVTVLIRKELFVGKVFSCLFALSLPLCVADWLCYLLQCDSPYSTVCILISFICVVVINVRIREFKATKIIILTIHTVLCIPCFDIVYGSDIRENRYGYGCKYT